ncbi:MAG: hypothetical protein L3J37_04395 [Rhodobacteraceae bacterium]|nr:hypothetical protein [Paracoccaceae bacterium]
MSTNKTTNRTNDVLVLLLLMLSSRSAFIRFEDNFLIAGFLLVAVLWFHGRQPVPSAFLVYLAATFFWIFLQGFISQNLLLTPVLGHLLRLGTGMLAVLMLGARFFSLFPLWVARLALVSLPFFLLGLLAPETIFTLYALTPDALRFAGGTLIDGRLDSAVPRASWLVYTLSPTRTGQNPGFMWEPAAFAMMTVSALTLRLATGHKSLDWQNITLVIATLSTLSTTGFIGLSLPLFYWALTTRAGALVLLAPLLALLALNLDFLLPKITAEFQADTGQIRWALSRYASFLRDMEFFAAHPLLGTGFGFETGYDSNNGLSDYLRRFGGLWFLAMVFLLFAAVRPRAHLGGTLTFIAVILLFSWSEKFFELPFFYALLFSAFLSTSGSKARTHARA